MQLEFVIKNLIQECQCLQALKNNNHKTNLCKDNCNFKLQKYKIYRNVALQNGKYQSEFILFLSRTPHKYSIKFRENLEIANVYRKYLGFTDSEFDLLDKNQIICFVNDLKHEFKAIIRMKNYQYTDELYEKTTLEAYYNKQFTPFIDVFKVNPLILFNKNFLQLQQCFNQTFPRISEKVVIFMPILCKDITKNVLQYKNLTK